jgi:hypothetical protein
MEGPAYALREIFTQIDEPNKKRAV